MKESLIIPNNILLGEVSSLLDKGKDVVLLAKGTSMEPFIRDSRDSVKLHRHESLVPGDIVLAKLPSGDWVLHRVFCLDGDDVTLMGDGNLEKKEKCRTCDIVGTVEAIIDEKGRERRPASGKIWKMLLPFRRYMLGIYRRIK